MATTATNKQPLLIDRVFHKAIATNTLTSGSDDSLDILGTNESAVLVQCSDNDGGIVEDLYSIARTTTSATYTALFYLSSSLDYLRPNESTLVAILESSGTSGTKVSASDLPKVLAPLPHTGSVSQLNALYIPRGMNLWVTLQVAGPVNSSDTPIIGAQGGFY